MVERPPLDPSRPLWGLDLRHAAVAVLMMRGPSSLSEILAAFERRGLTMAQRRDPPNKLLADALRHEISLGRVRRVSRGTYAALRMPSTTAWRIKNRWRS